jgi:biopolymer transport protein ExbB
MWDIFNLITWQQFFFNGGPVVAVLLVVGFILWFLIIERFAFIKLEFPKASKAVINSWHQRQDHASWNAHKIREALLSESKQSLERGLSTIKVLVAICPLLGLLGTVTGMLAVFEIISLTGNSDAKAMGGGIYKATLPTMVGLFLALSALYFNHALQSSVKNKISQLADQLNIFSQPDNKSKAGGII